MLELLHHVGVDLLPVVLVAGGEGDLVDALAHPPTRQSTLVGSIVASPGRGGLATCARGRGAGGGGGGTGGAAGEAAAGDGGAWGATSSSSGSITCSVSSAARSCSSRRRSMIERPK